MQKIVYFSGSLPLKGQTPVGGGEVGNLRSVRMLESFGFKLTIIRRIRSSSSDSKLKRLLSYSIRFVFNLSKFFIVLMFGNRKNSVVHIAGFYGATIAIETVQVFIAKLFGYRLIYEMRGGGAISFFENGNELYRKQFRYIVRKADHIFSQGRENEPLLKSLCDTPIFYYPNCVEHKFYLEKLPPKPRDFVNLVFFGRIEKQKNPLLIVETCHLLQNQFNNVRLTMIGNGQKEILESVRAAMKYLLQEGTYELIPGCAHEKLQLLLLEKHFYIFPSAQPREGQSNAVTEAMSLGIIPIASPQGFNRSTIGDDYLIVEDLTAAAYASRIASIILMGKTEKYSQFVRTRFLANYTEEMVFERTKEMYMKVFES